MVNQLKRKRSGSPVAFTKRLLHRDEKGEIGRQQHTPALTEAVLTAARLEQAGTALVTPINDQDDAEKSAHHGNDSEDVLDVYALEIPTTYPACISGMQRENRTISMLAVKSKRKGQIPTGEPEDERRLGRLTPYLNFLEYKLVMNHHIYKESKVADTLALMNNPKFYFPADVAERAARLVDEWQNKDWSDDEIESEDQPEAQDEASTSSTNGTASNHANEEAPAVRFRVPSARDPLFGINGMMNGVLSTRNSNGRKVHMLNPLLPHQSSKEFGHNGLQVGQWFPMRLVALHHGAHGASQAGISGSQTIGAYSIVAGNSAYHHLDGDHGETLYYSAPRSHENKDPRHLAKPTSGSKALRASVSTRKPVRVLRAAGGGNNEWLPPCGIRYDGLYRVAAIREMKNESGGLYEQFKLVRLGADVNGHETLRAIARKSPSAAQIAAYNDLMND